MPRPAAERLEDGPGGQSNLLDRDDVVEIIDRLRYQMDEPVADRQPEQYAERGSRRAERGRFAEDHRQDFPASRADRPQNRDVASALDHGEADSAIDEQCADEQRQQAHRGKVGGEGARHVERFAHLAGGLLELRSGRQLEPQLGERRPARGPAWHPDIDTSEVARQTQPFLGLGDVGEHQRGIAGPIAAQQADEDCPLRDTADIHCQRLTYVQSQLAGGAGRQNDRAGLEKPLSQLGERAAVNGACRHVFVWSVHGSVGERVHANELHHASGNGDIACYFGSVVGLRVAARGRLGDELHIERLIETLRTAGNDLRRGAIDRLHRQFECPA